MAHWVRSLDLTIHTSLSPIRRGFAPGFVNYKKGCTRLAAASDQVYQFLAHGRWFSPGTPASSTTKTGRHNIAEILLKVALNTQIQIKSILIHQIICCRDYCGFHYLPLWWSYHIIKDRTRANVIDEWRMQCFDSRWFYIFSEPTGRMSYYHCFTSSHPRMCTFSTLIFSQTTALIENKLGMGYPSWAVLHKVNLNHVIITGY